MQLCTQSSEEQSTVTASCSGAGGHSSIAVEAAFPAFEPRLTTLDVTSIAHIQSIIESTLSVLQNAAFPLDMWKKRFAEIENLRAARTKYGAEQEANDRAVVPAKRNHHKQACSASDILTQSCLEYIALFRVNRAQQSDHSSVANLRHVEDAYDDLLQETLLLMENARSKHNADIAECLRTHTLSLQKEASALRSAFEHAVELVQCAIRSKWSDQIARVSFLCEADLKAKMLTLTTCHSTTIADMERQILKCKKSVYDRSADIRKFKAQLTKYQKLMRKHGIVEHDEYSTFDDEKIKSDTILEHFASILRDRQAKLADTYAQMQMLSDMLERPPTTTTAAHTPMHRTPHTPATLRNGTPAAAGAASGGNGTPGAARRRLGGPASSVAASTPSNAATKPGTAKLPGKPAPALRTAEDADEWVARMVPGAQGRITGEEVLGIVAAARTTFDQKITDSREEYVQKLADERRMLDKMRVAYEEQYAAFVAELVRDSDFVEVLAIRNSDAITNVNKLFPVSQRPGTRTVEVQCDIEQAPRF
ncbi:hypothetical protein HDU83_009711 [Entophlyctis luteolus]|nr:hypothetical protein HDU82_003675 [Entophlyctis luteolus]KAJ3350426.1 hypothetical protein HDU83_009711 [Entophlyctis luteolus]